MKDKIRNLMVAAMKSKSEIAKNIYKVVLGEIGTQETRTGKSLSDEQIYSVVRKTLEGVKESLKYRENPVLIEEKQVLEGLLPQYLTYTEILTHLNQKSEEIKAAKNDGQATGIAVKYLKDKQFLFLGETAKEVIKEIRK